MDIKVDENYLLTTMQTLIECDSTVGYTEDVRPLMEELAGELGYQMTWDRKGTGYIRIAGTDRSRTVCLGAHLDTIGLVVRGINEDGTLRVRQLGGINYHSIEGECCHIHCRDGRVVDGQVICEHHSVHVWTDCRELARDEDHMVVSVIGDVKSVSDARALGISEGAICAIDPHWQLFDNGYIVSRHIDDKACVAALLGMAKWLKDEQITPAIDVLLAFPIYEEIGHGGSFVPEGVEEYVAADISLIGPDYDADEHHVGVISADAHGPYDWQLTNHLIELAEKNIVPEHRNTQVCFRYSTDAMAAYIHANDIAAAAFGPACLNTHGRERCHKDAVIETQRLASAYVLALGER